MNKGRNSLAYRCFSEWTPGKGVRGITGLTATDNPRKLAANLQQSTLCPVYFHVINS